MKSSQFKKSLISFILLLSVFVVPFLVSFDFAPNNNLVPTSPPTDTCLFNMNELCEYYKCYVQTKYDNVTEIDAYEIGRGNYVTERMPNMNQTRLNTLYNNDYKTSFDGTCAEVAIAQIIYHFTKETYKDHCFIHAMNIARGLQYFPASNPGGEHGLGTVYKSEKAILNNGYSYYNTDYKGNLDTVNLMSTIKSEIDAGRPVLTYVIRDNVKDETERIAHDVVAVGYAQIYVPYKRNVRKFGFFGPWVQKDYSLTFDTLVVNNGWVDESEYYVSDWYEYRFYPSTLLDESYIVKTR